jgi:hypothetical protein
MFVLCSILLVINCGASETSTSVEPLVKSAEVNRVSFDELGLDTISTMLESVEHRPLPASALSDSMIAEKSVLRINTHNLLHLDSKTVDFVSRVV